MTKRALLGFHNHRDVEAYGWFFEDKNYSLESVSSLKQMLEKMRDREYDWYLMDVNLGNEGGLDITPSRAVWNLVKERVERGEARFLALSYAEPVVLKAKAEGIPAEDTCKIRLTEIVQEAD